MEVSKAPAKSTANAVTDSIARVRSEDHGRKAKRGMARAMARGRRLGRPRKPLTGEKAALAIRLRREKGWGYCRIAREVNRLRGADRLASRTAARRRGVSKLHIARFFRNLLA